MMSPMAPTGTMGDIRDTEHFRPSDGGLSAGAVGQHTTRNTMMLAEITGNIHVAAACLAAAIGVGMIGKGASEAVGRNPGAATQILVQAILSTAFAEGIVFFALFLCNGK